jgi:hypothetical protein
VLAKNEAKKARRKTDPELLKFSRELRDRWQEHVFASPTLLENKQQAKYQVARLIGELTGQAGESATVGEGLRVVQPNEPMRIEFRGGGLSGWRGLRSFRGGLMLVSGRGVGDRLA